MNVGSHIEWTDATWNPVTGCTKVSQGCKNCYADRMAKRLQLMGKERYRNGFAVTLQDDLVDLPRRWRTHRKIFVNSMSDLFHPLVPTDFIERIFKTMEECPQHIFQVLTKRDERLLEMSDHLPWPSNVWMGVSIEDNVVVERARNLAKTGAAVKFLSCEPLIGSLSELDLEGIDWVIAGGESGPRARPMQERWALELRDKCIDLSIPFFFKQWGGVNKKKTGRILDERTWNEFPNSAERIATPLLTGIL